MRSTRMRKLLLGGSAIGLLVLLLSSPASAQVDLSEGYDRGAATGAEAMNTIVLDNIFIFFAAVLVFLMQPGFALLEAGLTRAKNAANIMMKNLMDLSAGVLVFALVGWGIAYPGDFNGWVGSAGLGIKDFFAGAFPDAAEIGSEDFYPARRPRRLLLPGRLRRHRRHDRVGRGGRSGPSSSATSSTRS